MTTGTTTRSDFNSERDILDRCTTGVKLDANVQPNNSARPG
jgi:hypothetical protein